MDVSSDDSLRPGPEPPEGLRHGVPVEGLHHLHDQVRHFVVKLYTDPKFRDVTHKIVQRSTGRRSGRPDLLLPHVRVRFSLSQSIVILLASDMNWPVPYPSHSINVTAQVLWHHRSYSCSENAHLLHQGPLWWAPTSRSAAHNLFQVHPARSSETIMAVVASCWFIFDWMCLFFCVRFGKHLRWIWAK